MEKFFIGNQNNQARALMKIFIGDKNNRARLIYAAVEDTPEEAPFTIVNIYDSITKQLIQTWYKKFFKPYLSIRLSAEDNVSAVYFGDLDDTEGWDLVGLENAALSGKLYYPQFIGLSLNNDDNTLDDGDIALNTSHQLEPGEEYNYYLLYDGERVTIDGKKYWIPEEGITWKKAAENDLLPVVLGPYNLVTINKNNSLYAVGNGTDWDVPVLDSRDNYDLYTYVESEDEPVDGVPIVGIIKGTNITWRYAISINALNSNDIPCTIEDGKVVATRGGRKYTVKTPEGVAVSPDDVIMSFAVYQLEKIGDIAIFTIDGIEYPVPESTTTWKDAITTQILSSEFTWNEDNYCPLYNGRGIWTSAYAEALSQINNEDIEPRAYYTIYDECHNCGRPVVPGSPFCDAPCPYR